MTVQKAIWFACPRRFNLKFCCVIIIIIFTSIYIIVNFNFKSKTIFIYKVAQSRTHNFSYNSRMVNDYLNSYRLNRQLNPPSVRLGKFHQHIFNTVNNSLITGQGKQFKLPLDINNNQKLFGTMPMDIFPNRNNETNSSFYSDRIWNQMRYVPLHIASRKIPPKKKLILLYNGMSYASNDYLNACPVNSCILTADRELAKRADVILFENNIVRPFHKRPANQVWVVYFLESPKHTPNFKDSEPGSDFVINWTATYRSDSTIVTPYGKYTPYNLADPVPDKYPLPKLNYAQSKTKMIAWFVSNCASSNNRIKYAKELSEFIKVDIYGKCGSLNCPRQQAHNCFDMLKKTYRFYLAFENSNCREYITEKFFHNSLTNNVIPIVMGASLSDYKRVAPPHSFIHVDEFDGPQNLAKYLFYLYNNQTAYNEYFAWKDYGTVIFNTYFWCRLCMMAHEADITSYSLNKVYKWWNGTPDSPTCSDNVKWSKHNQ